LVIIIHVFLIKKPYFPSAKPSSQGKSTITTRNLIQKVNKVFVFGSIRLLRLGKLERIRFLDINLDSIFLKRQNFRYALFKVGFSTWRSNQKADLWESSHALPEQKLRLWELSREPPQQKVGLWELFHDLP
jgi:hypothetical protein